MIYYLAGPMSNIINDNYPAFEEAAQELRAAGIQIVSPHETFVCHDKSKYLECLKRDVATMSTCDGMILLPGWTKSRGARLEVTLALSLEMPLKLFRNGVLYDIS